MTTIFEKKGLSSLFLGEQPIQNKKYRLNRFCIKKSVNNTLIIYNNLIKKAVFLDENESRILESLPCDYNSELDIFIKDWFAVPEDADECKYADQIFEASMLYEKKKGITNYVILTTTDCNARCFYCYEHGVKKTHMTNKTAQDVVQFILNNYDNNPISIKWFGGEPLYNSQAIDIICDGLKANNVEFTSRMTTNGYLFDNDIIYKAKNNWNLKRVQISLDGTEEKYNKIKAYIYRDGKSPFAKVINNIKSLLKNEINVNIRLNVSDNNRDNMYTLIDFLKSLFGDNDYLSVYSSNLFDLDKTRNRDEIIRLNKKYFELDDYLVSTGLRQYDLNTWASHTRGCMAQNNNSVVISPEGLLGKCEHFSEGERMYGSIYTDKIDCKSISYWKEFHRIDVCNDCVAYPNCCGIGHCPDASAYCELEEKIIKYNNMAQGLLAAYQNYKKQENI